MLALPTLKHIGMALVQYTLGKQSDAFIKTDADGKFQCRFVAFGFANDKEAIQLHIPFEIIKDMEKMDLRFLPIVQGKTFCEIVKPNQLAAAVRYIELAQGWYLTTRLSLPPDRN